MIIAGMIYWGQVAGIIICELFLLIESYYWFLGKEE